MSEDPRTGAGTNDMQRYAVRGQAVFEPDDALKVRLIAAHSEIPGSKGSNEPDMFYGAVPAALNASVRSALSRRRSDESARVPQLCE